MSLIKCFPEVETFFENDSFTQEDLLLFVEEIENKYIESDERESVSALIKLKILQFELSDNTSLPPKNKSIKHKKIKVLYNDNSNNDKIHISLQSLKHNSIENIALNIHWPTSRLINILKQKEIFKSPQDLLDEVEFSSVINMFNSRLKSLDRAYINQKKIVIKKSPKKSLSKQLEVYNKIESIGLGKLIYIRKK